MRWLRVSLVVALVLTSALSADAATTSRLEGRALDDQNRPLAGAQITISSGSLIGGPQTAVTGKDGGFAFNFLLVGVYTVNAELVGYTPSTASARVQLDRAAKVTLRLIPVSFKGEIEVEADVPIVNPTRTNTGEIFDEQYLQLASIGSENRDYLAIMNQVAGVVPDYLPRVYGASPSDNAFIVDGFNTTDPSTGASATRLNFDAIEEASALTGGMGAEFGFGTGGVLNVVTKSGGNNFSGTFDARYSDERFIESGEYFDPGEDTFSNRLLSATLGGPILRDRLWFFAAVEHDVQERTPYRAPETRLVEVGTFLGKLTWAINPANRLTAKVSTTPTTIDYHGTWWGATPEATYFVDANEPIGQLELNSVLSDRLLLTAGLGFSREHQDFMPMINDLDTQPEAVDGPPPWYRSNPDFVEFSDRHRDNHHVKLTWFAGEALGSHQVDAGLEYHKLRENTANFTPGGYTLEYLDNEYLDPPYPDGDGDGLVDVELVRDAPAETAGDPRQGEADGWSVFVQDRWRPIPELTLNIGLRYDTMAHTNTIGETVADFDKWLPRLGVAWDVGGRNRHVLRASVGRYMHPGVTNLAMKVPGVIRGREYYLGLDILCGEEEVCDRETAIQEIGPEFIHVDSDGDEHPFYLYWTENSVPAETVDTLGVARLRAPYRDELILAYETRVAHETSLEVSYVRKVSQDMIEDTCNNNTWAWGDGDPPTLDDPSTWTDEEACTGSVRVNMDGPSRDYEAVVLRAASRARPWFHLLGTYTYSKVRTNTGSQPYTGFGSGIRGFPGSEFDYFPTNFVNRDGDLESIQQWLKLNGYFRFPLDFILGVGATFASEGNAGIYSGCGEMLNPNGFGLAVLERLGIDYDEMVQYCQSEHSGTILLDTQTGFGANWWQLDLQISKAFRIKSVRLIPIVSVFNVTSEEAVTYTEEYLWSEEYYGTPQGYQQPRRWEVGFRIEF